MELDEGPRQDRAIELFNELLPLRQAQGDKHFRTTFITTMMKEFDMNLATASNAYNYARKEVNLPDLGRTAARAAKGLPPVVRPPRQRDMSDPTAAPTNAPMNGSSSSTGKSDPRQLLKDSEKYDGMTDEDDIEWERYADKDNLEISWGLQYSGMTATEAMNEYKNEVNNANHTLEKFAHKYKDRLGRLKPQTMEKAQKSDQLKGGPSKGIEYLSGSVDFRL